MSWYSNFENCSYAGPELYPLYWVLKGITCHFSLDRRFCEHLSIDVIHWSNVLSLREQNFVVPLSYILVVSRPRCFDFGDELTLGGLPQKHVARYNKLSQGCCYCCCCCCWTCLCHGMWAVSSGEYIPTFRNILLTSFSRSSSSRIHENVLLDRKAEGNTIFRKAVKPSSEDTASDLRRTESSARCIDDLLSGYYGCIESVYFPAWPITVCATL